MKAKIFTGPSGSGKTTTAKLIAEYFDKDKVAFISGRHLNAGSLPRFLFTDVSDSVELIIIDDCPYNFNYGNFFAVIDNTHQGGDLRFVINVERRGENSKQLVIPYLIFITEQLDPKWLCKGYSFSGRFDIVEFPISANTNNYDPTDLVQKITFNGELLLTLTCKRDWINQVPNRLPKMSQSERLVFLDANGNCASIGLDFQAAEQKQSYPIKVYRMLRISESL